MILNKKVFCYKSTSSTKFKMNFFFVLKSLHSLSLSPGVPIGCNLGCIMRFMSENGLVIKLENIVRSTEIKGAGTILKVLNRDMPPLPTPPPKLLTLLLIGVL